MFMFCPGLGTGSSAGREQDPHEVGKRILMSLGNKIVTKIGKRILTKAGSKILTKVRKGIPTSLGKRILMRLAM